MQVPNQLCPACLFFKYHLFTTRGSSELVLHTYCRSKEGALHSAHRLWLCPSVNAWFSFKDPLWSSSSWWYQELDLANLWCSDIHVWDKARQQLLQIAPLTTEVIMTQWEQRPFGGHAPRFRNMSFKNYQGHCALISAGVLYLSDWLSALMGHSVMKLMF